MGKSVNLIGTLRGKVGSVVFSKGLDNTTVVRPYQPQVANPRTAGQQVQRARVTLAGKISKIIPAEALSGLMKGGKLRNRSAFVGNIVNKSVVTASAGVYNAAVGYADLVFSEGQQVLNATLGAITLAARTVTVALTNVVADNRNGMRLVVVTLDTKAESASEAYRMAAFADFVFTENQASAVVNLPFTLGEGDGVLVYACPFRLVEGGRKASTAGVWYVASDNTVDAEYGETISANAEFGRSVFGGLTVMGQ